MPSAEPTDTGGAEQPSQDERLFDNGFALLLEAAQLDQPFLPFDLMIAMRSGPAESDSSAP